MIEDELPIQQKLSHQLNDYCDYLITLQPKGWRKEITRMLTQYIKILVWRKGLTKDTKELFDGEIDSATLSIKIINKPKRRRT